jgi:hypothetical protein
MWADQITASEEPIVSSALEEGKEEPPVSGYSVEPVDEGVKEEVTPADKDVPASEEPSVEPKLSYAEVVAEEPEDEAEQAPQNVPVQSPEETPIQDAQSSTPVAFPSSPVEEDTAEPETVPADASQPSESAVAFPGGDETASLQAPSLPTSPAPAQSPGVTFASSESTPRSGTPDANAEPKRKRISSQNFQRMARRISISGKRSGSASIIPNLIPGLKREGSAAKDDNSSHKGEGSLSRTDSPSAGVAQEEGGSQKDKKDKKKEKKERKEQKKRGTIG